MKYIREIREANPDYPCWEHSIRCGVVDGETVVRYLVKPYSVFIREWDKQIANFAWGCSVHSFEVDGIEDLLIEAFRANMLDQKNKADKELAKIQDHHDRLADIVTSSFHRSEKVDKLFE